MRKAFLALVIAAAPATAHAGRTFYGWLYGTEVMPERGVELQSWITEENEQTTDPSTMKVAHHETSWLFAPLVGITDQLEVGFPIELLWASEADKTTNRVDRYGIEARYRFVTQDPEDAPEFVPLVRVAVKRLVAERSAVRSELDFVASYETGIVHILADVGFIATIDPNAETKDPVMGKNAKLELHPGLGVSLLTVGDLRVGVEGYSELKFNEAETETWVAVGPDVAWTHGRFWLSATYAFGLYNITNAPRFLCGIAF